MPLQSAHTQAASLAAAGASGVRAADTIVVSV